MPSNAVTDIVELLGQQCILEGGHLAEVKSLQGRFADARRPFFRELVQRGWIRRLTRRRKSCRAGPRS